MLFFNEIKQIEINPTELCNLACSFCPRSTFYPNTNEHMSLEVAEEIKDQMATSKFSGVLSITGRGEPTLHPWFEEFVSVFTGGTWKLKMHTNGKRFAQHEEFILNNFHEVYYNCYDRDPREVELKYKDNDNVEVVHKPRDVWFDKATNRAGSFTTNYMPADKTCDVPFHKMFIDVDGTYRLCCEDWSEKVSLGNIFEKSIVEFIEDDERLSDYRRKLIHGDRSNSPCSSCNYSLECDKYNRKQDVEKYKVMVEMEGL